MVLKFQDCKRLRVNACHFSTEPPCRDRPSYFGALTCFFSVASITLIPSEKKFLPCGSTRAQAPVRCSTRKKFCFAGGTRAALWPAQQAANNTAPRQVTEQHNDAR